MNQLLSLQGVQLPIIQAPMGSISTLEEPVAESALVALNLSKLDI